MRTRLSIGLLSTILLAIVGPCWDAAVQAIPVSVTSILVSDRQADPLNRGGNNGAGFMMRYNFFTTFISSPARGLRDPAGGATSG